MAVRLIGLARITSCLLVPKIKQVASQSRTYLLKRERLVPFLDDDPCVFSKKAIMHHWGVLPIIGICSIGLLAKIFVIIALGMKKDDVWFTKDSAYCETFETRKGPWYKYKSRKWGGRDDYTMPAGATLAKQGYTDGPSFSEETEEGLTVEEVAAHVAVTAVAITVAATVL